MKQFENMTIGEFKKRNERYKEQNPEVKTAEELLNELNNKEEQ